MTPPDTPSWLDDFLAQLSVFDAKYCASLRTLAPPPQAAGAAGGDPAACVDSDDGIDDEALP